MLQTSIQDPSMLFHLHPTRPLGSASASLDTLFFWKSEPPEQEQLPTPTAQSRVILQLPAPATLSPTLVCPPLPHPSRILSLLRTSQHPVLITASLFLWWLWTSSLHRPPRFMRFSHEVPGVARVKTEDKSRMRHPLKASTSQTQHTPPEKRVKLAGGLEPLRLSLPWALQTSQGPAKAEIFRRRPPSSGETGGRGWGPGSGRGARGWPPPNWSPAKGQGRRLGGDSKPQAGVRLGTRGAPALQGPSAASTSPRGHDEGPPASRARGALGDLAATVGCAERPGGRGVGALLLSAPSRREADSAWRETRVRAFPQPRAGGGAACLGHHARSGAATGTAGNLQQVRSGSEAGWPNSPEV